MKKQNKDLPQNLRGHNSYIAMLNLVRELETCAHKSLVRGELEPGRQYRRELKQLERLASISKRESLNSNSDKSGTPDLLEESKTKVSKHLYISNPKRNGSIEVDAPPPVTTYVPPAKLSIKLYIINQEGTDMYKIGYTRIGVSNRLSVLQCGNPNPLKYIGGFLIDGVGDEETLHRLFEHKRIQGEWFHLTKDDITNILDVEWQTQNNIRNRQQ